MHTKDLICTHNIYSKAISLYTKPKGDKSTMYTKSKGDNPSTQSQKMITLTGLVSTRHEKKLYSLKNIFFIKKYFSSFHSINKEDYPLMVPTEL